MQSFCFFPHCFLPFFLKSLVAFRPVKDLTEDSVFPQKRTKRVGLSALLLFAGLIDSVLESSFFLTFYFLSI